MATAVKPIPDKYSSVTPYLVLQNAEAALAFYKKAFGAEEVYRMAGPGGRGVMHAEVRIGNALVMLCDAMPMMTYWVAPPQLHGTTVCLHLYVTDVDAAFQKAVDAGATVVLPVNDAFWGDRYGRLRDPFGHEWSIATHKQDLTPEQIAKAAEEFVKKMTAQQCH